MTGEEVLKEANKVVLLYYLNIFPAMKNFLIITRYLRWVTPVAINEFAL